MLPYLVIRGVAVSVEPDMIDQKTQFACVVIFPQIGLSPLREKAESFGKAVHAGSGCKWVVDAWRKGTNSYLHKFHQNKFHVLRCGAIIPDYKTRGDKTVRNFVQRLFTVYIGKRLTLHDKIARTA